VQWPLQTVLQEVHVQPGTAAEAVVAGSWSETDGSEQAAGLHAAEDKVTELAQGAPSALAGFLRPFGDAARLVAQVASENRAVVEALQRYQHDLRWVEPLIDGNTLQQMNVPPGPIYRQILSTLRK